MGPERISRRVLCDVGAGQRVASCEGSPAGLTWKDSESAAVTSSPPGWMSVEEVDPVLGSSERNGQMAVPGWACLSEGRAHEEVHEMALGQNGDIVDRLELDVAGFGWRLSERDD
jgi:hypothetical protein